MTESTDLTPVILGNIQSDLADLRDRLTAFEARMEARWEANEARWEANEVRWRDVAAEQASIRTRLGREQALRERNSRKTLELFDVLIKKVQDMDLRVTTLADS